MDERTERLEIFYLLPVQRHAASLDCKEHFAKNALRLCWWPEPEETSYTVRCPIRVDSSYGAHRTLAVGHHEGANPLARTSNDVPRRLVIVESPAKAKTIAGYLGRGYVVESSFGHIRDLPSKKTDVPPAQRERFGDPIGVDVEGGFEPLYVVPAGRAKDQVRKLKAALKDADELLLATDEDREGEAIAWHLREELRPKVPVRRMVFHEITRDAIQSAVQSPREIDEDLVDAQETRRIVDRLYGYEVSPVLWRKVMQGLSAGRVQSVATRLVVDRERDRMAFRTAQYWDLSATLDTGTSDDPHAFEARLATVDGSRVAAGRDFDSRGALKDRSSGVVVLDEERARSLASALDGAAFQVRSVEAKPYRRSPYAPFRTTTLQQEASRKLGFGAARTMQVAQRLYESGLITYMRTDSITLSDAAVSAARAKVAELYGADYLPDAPRRYTGKVKSAQEAHEAIRPAGDGRRGRRSLHQAAGALHRGDAGQGARGPRHRPPVDVRVDHPDHPGPRLRVQEGLRAGAIVAGVRRRSASGGALRVAGRLRVHRADGGPTRRDRAGPGQAACGARPVLERR